MAKIPNACLLFIAIELGKIYSGLELVRVPRVPGTRGIFGQYCPAPVDFGVLLHTVVFHP